MNGSRLNMTIDPYVLIVVRSKKQIAYAKKNIRKNYKNCKNNVRLENNY